MKKTLMLFTLLAMIMGICPIASAQMNEMDAKELIMDSVELERKALISANVDLTEEESTLFWTSYNQYRSDMKNVNDDLLALIVKYSENYENLSDDLASELMSMAMEIEENRMIHKQVYIEDLVKILPMKKVVVLYQLENKIDAALKYELAEMIPFVPASNPDAVE